MKAMLTAFAAMILIAVGSNFALQQFGFSSQDTFSGPSVRLD
ncbi:MAG: hypothetical protein ACJA1E_001619 [Paracoccaceae bacterium]|jgi:hypothetical protein